LLLLFLGRVSNAPHFIVDVVACDFQCRYNFSSHVDQIFDEALLEASIVRSNMSNDFFAYNLITESLIWLLNSSNFRYSPSLSKLSFCLRLFSPDECMVTVFPSIVLQKKRGNGNAAMVLEGAQIASNPIQILI